MASSAVTSWGASPGIIQQSPRAKLALVAVEVKTQAARNEISGLLMRVSVHGDDRAASRLTSTSIMRSPNVIVRRTTPGNISTGVADS